MPEEDRCGFIDSIIDECDAIFMLEKHGSWLGRRLSHNDSYVKNYIDLYQNGAERVAIYNNISEDVLLKFNKISKAAFLTEGSPFFLITSGGNGVRSFHARYFSQIYMARKAPLFFRRIIWMKMKKILIVCLAFYIAGCTSTIKYSPKAMDIETAIDTADQLIMTQQRKWRPEGFGINEKYLSLGFGDTTTKVLNKLYTKGSGERIYYNQVKYIGLMKWWGHSKWWYVVTVYNNQGRNNKHLFYSRNIKESELFFDSLYTIFNHPYEIETVSPQPPNLNKYK